MTYAWSDNKDNDIDFIASELQSKGLTIKLDRWNITAGGRLWDQISHFIQSPEESDAWLIVATQTSLASEACREELAYALDRALNQRSQTFPVIGLFLGSVDQALIPASIRVRLFVSIEDVDWKERIVAAVEKRAHNVTHPQVKPFYIKVYPNSGWRGRPIAIELRPRAGVWAPFFAAVPVEEKDLVDFDIIHGPSKFVPHGSAISKSKPFLYGNGKWLYIQSGNQATPTQSFYILCKALPSSIAFGVPDTDEAYEIKLNELSGL